MVFGTRWEYGWSGKVVNRPLQVLSAVSQKSQASVGRAVQQATNLSSPVTVIHMAGFCIQILECHWIFPVLLIPKIPPHLLGQPELPLDLVPSLTLLADSVGVRLTVWLLIPRKLSPRQNPLTHSALALVFLLAQESPPDGRGFQVPHSHHRKSVLLHRVVT